jgi:glycosyltransferase involved in cell wall biosynthesis
MKIAIVVQGRFHAFDLTKALLARGHDVTLFTNYPRWAVRQFGLSPDCVRSFWPHGVISKGAYSLRLPATLAPDRWLNQSFGKWAASQLAKEHWDAIHCWSGVAEETYRQKKDRHCMRLLMRGSSHISVQDAILAQEEERTGIRLDRPGNWAKERERREYMLADSVVVLSSFARDTFLAQGFPASRLWLVPNAADTGMFRPSPEVVRERCGRILSGRPLKVLYVGALSLRKGLWDARTIVSRLAGGPFRFQFVGPTVVDAVRVVDGLKGFADVVPKVPQRELPRFYFDSDLFMFPTLEDGFPAVLAHAQASGLPILTTPNGSGPDLIEEGKTGWIRPIRSPEAFVETLLWCDANRSALAEMVKWIYESHRVRVWEDVAKEFEQVCWDAPRTAQSNFSEVAVG